MKRVTETSMVIVLILLAWSGLPLVDAALAGSTSTPAAEKAATPNIMIPEPLFTFEPVVDGMEVVHDFRVYNRGEGELAIEKVQTG